MSELDLGFPECCSFCPHHRAVKGNCSHEFRQSLVDYFADHEGTCPVYADVKTTAMRTLRDQLAN